MRNLPAFLFLFIGLALPGLYLQGAPPDAKVGTIRGQVGVGGADGTLVPARSAQVYVLFSQAMQENGSFPHSNSGDSAAARFHAAHEKALGSVKKNTQEIDKNYPPEQRAGKIGEYYLKGMDESLATAKAWTAQHPDKAWQIRTATPDERGLWNVEDLKPGTYDVVVRGQVAGREACWEASVDLRPDRTISLPLDRPRFMGP